MEMQAMKCVKAGSGQHAVLLLPGALGTIKLRTKTYRVHYYKLMIRFRTDLPTLLDPKTGLNSRGDLTLVAVDLPGFGASCPPERTWPLKYHRRDAKFAVRLMQKIGFETFSIVGWSDGGRHSRRCSVPTEKYYLFFHSGISGLCAAAAFPNVVRKLAVWGAQARVTKEDVDQLPTSDDFDIALWPEYFRAPRERAYGPERFTQLSTELVAAFKRIHRLS